MSDSRALIAAAARRLAAAGVDNPRLDARLLWEHAFLPLQGERSEREGIDRNALFDSFVARRIAREPLAYITGRKEFWSLEFEVGPGVLIPRPETETIIEQALQLMPDRSAPLRVLDLGTGSGCLLVAFLKEFPNSRGLGIDASEVARRYATANIARHGLAGRAEILAGNWAQEISGRWDAILSNPPYIRSGDIDALAPEVRFEPRAALDGGADGLSAIRELAHATARLLGGFALTEIGAGQEAAAASIMAEAGLAVTRVVPDLAGIPRVMVTAPAA